MRLVRWDRAYVTMALGFGSLVGCGGGPQEPTEPGVPVLASLSPATAPTGSGVLTLTITGSGFVPNSVVQWEGSSRTTTFVSSSELTASIPATDLDQPGTFPVRVFTPAPGGGSSAPLDFTVLAPEPSISSLSKSTAVAGDPVFTLLVSGSGYLPTSVVRWNGEPLPTTYVYSGLLEAVVSSTRLAVDAEVPVTVFTEGPGGGVSNALTFTIAPLIREVGLTTSDLIYDPKTARIYASVPGTAGARANTITRINPENGVILESVPIGDEPGKLALSDDGSILYVALDGTGEVRMFDMATQTPRGAAFSLGSGTYGTRYAEDLDVMPGSPLSVAVSMKFPGFSPRHAGLAVFDDGVLRGDPTDAGHSGPNVIAFSASGSTLYGLHNETNDGGLSTVSVGASGPSLTDFTYGLILWASDIEFAGGRLYGTSGAVVDPVARQVLGTFAVPGVEIYGSQMVIDPPNGRAVFVGSTTAGYGTALHAFDLSTFQPIRSLALPAIPSPADATSLIRWGTDGLALRVINQVYLVRTSLVRR